MQAKYISYQDTHAFSAAVLDYLACKEQLKPYYKYSPNLKGFASAIPNRNFKGDRALLVEILQKQYGLIKSSSSVKANINLLADEHTFTVTTGHQLNIFTGPLYFIYKIVSTINLARELRHEFPNYNFVPVYWMATEDHDFEEINHVKLEDKVLTWNKKTSGATGKLNIKDIEDVLIAYKGFLGITENGLKFSRLVEDAYTKHVNLSDATRELVDSLFGRHGLVCIDADEPALKAQFAEIIYTDIIEENSSKLIADSNAGLEKLGYKPQVNPREINFFYMTEGSRERIIEDKGSYRIKNTPLRFTKEELKNEISAYPEKFSPNVVMRPLYQEVILPNLAYIGGGAEVTYWLQLKANFDHYHIPFPILLLRNSVQFIDKRSEQRMHILGISQRDLFNDTLQLENDWIKSHINLQFSLSEEEKAINAVFDQIKANAFIIDKTLAQSADAAKTRALKLISNLEKKMLRAEKRKHKTSLAQIESLKGKLFPSGGLQERVMNIAPMYVAYGDGFIDSLLEHLKPLDNKFTILFD